MDISYIVGWIFLLASWIPKPFIKDERKRLGTNLVLVSIATSIFIGSFIHLITK